MEINVIRTESPVEVYRIINPIPALLDEAAASGTPVRVEARVVQGDNVAVERIDGKTYGRAEKGERQGRVTTTNGLP